MQKRINFPGKMQECVIICTRRIAASFIGGLSRVATQADADYWICAMHPSVHSQKPGKCPICGMDLIPVTHRKEESSKTDEFMVPIQRQQQTGVTYAEVRSRQMRMELSAVGTLEVDQAHIFELVTRLDGYIEEL